MLMLTFLRTLAPGYLIAILQIFIGHDGGQRLSHMEHHFICKKKPITNKLVIIIVIILHVIN